MNMTSEIAKIIRERLAALSDEELVETALGIRPVSPKPIPAQINEEPASTVRTPRRVITPDESQQVYNVLKKEQRGLCMGEITDMTGLNASRVRTIIKRLNENEKSVFSHGSRRFTRYAVCADMARRASLLAEGKDPGKEKEE